MKKCHELFIQFVVEAAQIVMFVQQGSRAGSAVAQHWEAGMVGLSLRGQGTHVNHVHPTVVITQTDAMTRKKCMVVKGKCYFTFVAKECNYFAKRNKFSYFL